MWSKDSKTRPEEFIAKDYHKVSDKVKPDWYWTGALEDLQLLMEVVWSVANGDEWLRWKDGSEFKARLEAVLGSGGRRP